jgi:hypothetical protein
MNIDLNSREFLHNLENEAWKRSQLKGTNQMWASVYRRLAEVACELDAFLTRSSESIIEPSPKPKKK